uniref:Uncharacterized protein n=1 Tax=Wuchereria bancrofti TaxID=6293 RepID=A0AAF5PQM0_WUCBA
METLECVGYSLIEILGFLFLNLSVFYRSCVKCKVKVCSDQS